MVVSRVPQTVIKNNIMNYVARNKEREAKAQEKISTGRKLNAPSDNPLDAIKSIKLETVISKADQYLRNISHGRGMVDFTESALNSVVNILEDAKAIALSQANGTYSQADRQAAAASVQGLFDQLVQIGNSSLENRYVFGGYNTTTAPFDAAGNYSGADGDINISIGVNQSITINSSGGPIFKGVGGGEDLFDILSDLRNGLLNNSVTDISTQIGRLETALQQVNREIATLGVRSNMMDLAKNDLEESKFGAERILSEISGADLMKATAELAAQRNVTEASIVAAARAMGLSIMDLLA